MIAITRLETPQSVYGLKCPHTMKPSFIVIHNTANDASAMAEISYMLRNGEYTSFHFAVDEERAVQGLPLDRNGWHAGDGANGRGNRYGIGIEICHSKSGGAGFEKAERNAAELTALLLQEYGWDIGRVTKHQDYSGKYCPRLTLDLGWERFLDIVRAKLGELERKSAQSVGITAGDLVRITGTRYATGQPIPEWVKAAEHRVCRIEGDRALLGAPGGITSWVCVGDIIICNGISS